MGIARKSLKPVAITNESGQPEIVLQIGGLTLSMAPPAHDAPADDDHAKDQAESAEPAEPN